MKTHLYLKFLIIILLTGCRPEMDEKIKSSIIPKPLSQEIGTGYFIFNHDITIISEPKLLEVSNYFTYTSKRITILSFQIIIVPKKLLLKLMILSTMMKVMS